MDTNQFRARNVRDVKCGRPNVTGTAARDVGNAHNKRQFANDKKIVLIFVTKTAKNHFWLKINSYIR